jgi:hypothetical protein
MASTILNLNRSCAVIFIASAVSFARLASWNRMDAAPSGEITE